MKINVLLYFLVKLGCLYYLKNKFLSYIPLLPVRFKSLEFKWD